MRKKSVCALLMTAILCVSCQSKPASQQEETATAAQAQSEMPSDSVESLMESDVSQEEYEQIDVSKLPATAVTTYTQGTRAFTLGDILPVASDSSGYTQKWEFYIYTKPYEARIKFEISNFAFSKNELKLKGYVRQYDGEVQVAEYPISESFKSGTWTLDKGVLSVKAGDYSLSWSDGLFHVNGAFERGRFSYDIPANPWKPGTGNVYFGNSTDNIFKYSVLTYHKPVSRGEFEVDGARIDVSGQAYGNHYVTTVPVYDMFDEVSDFRHRTDDLLVEFRYYVPSAKYDAKPFGFLFVGFDGTPVLSSMEIERTALDRWLDDGNYGYEIDSRQRIEGKEGSNRGIFEMLTAEPRAIDPYADLPTFQRNVAMRFAKPIEYSILIDWVLHLYVDGYEAKIPVSNTYTITRLR